MLVAPSIAAHLLSYFTLMHNVLKSHVLAPMDILSGFELTLKAPITTATDDKFYNIFPNFHKNVRYDVS